MAALARTSDREAQARGGGASGRAARTRPDSVSPERESPAVKAITSLVSVGIRPIPPDSDTRAESEGAQALRILHVFSSESSLWCIGHACPGATSLQQSGRALANGSSQHSANGAAT